MGGREGRRGDCEGLLRDVVQCAGWLGLLLLLLLCSADCLPPLLLTCCAAGERRLLIKYRPAKKAAVHLRALGLVDQDGAPCGGGAGAGTGGGPDDR